MARSDGQEFGGNRDAWWALLVVAALLVLAVIAFVTAQGDLNDQATAAVLAASVTGAVTVFVAGFGLVNRRDERSERLTTRRQEIDERADIRGEDAVFRAFEYFTGKTQRRNVGISILEHYWH